MKNKSIIITALLLTITISNYFRITSTGNVRTVEFFSIFAMGLLTGVLIFQIALGIKRKKHVSN